MLKLIISLRPYTRYLLVVWVATIIILSSVPNVPTLKIRTEKNDIRLDYLIHFCEYGLLTFLTFLAFAGNEYIVNSGKVIIITVSLILFAILDEYHQKFIPGRAFNLKDIFSNITGILVIALFCSVIFERIARKIRIKDKL